MSLFKRLFARKKQPGKGMRLEAGQVDIAMTTEERFAMLSSDERLGTVITLGDSGQVKYFDILRYSIQSDPDINVRFAALKRIHLFKDHPDLIPFLKGLNEKVTHSTLEPYLSMALSRVGIISLEEFKQRINNPAMGT